MLRRCVSITYCVLTHLVLDDELKILAGRAEENGALVLAAACDHLVCTG